MLRKSAHWLLAVLAKSTLIMGLWKAASAHWRNALWWSFCNLFGALLPLWLTIFLRHLFMSPAHLHSFIDGGDFVLYAAAFLAPTIYQVAVRMRRVESILQMGTIILSSFGLLLAAVTFVAVSPELGPSIHAKAAIDGAFLVHISYFLFSFSFLVSVAVFLNEAQLEKPDLDAASKVDQAFLAGSFQLRRPETAPGLVVPGDQGHDGIESQNLLEERFRSSQERHE